MTIREKLQKELEDCGLFPDQATEVIDRYVTSEMGAPMCSRMNDNPADYPGQVIAATWIGIKVTALSWIDETIPEHWARPMFT